MSLTLAINRNLHLVTLFLVVILAGILVHRIIRIFCNALISAIIAIQYPSYTSNSLKSSLQKYAHHSLIGHSVAFLALIFNSCVHLTVTALRAFLMVLYILLPVVIVSLVMVIINEKWSEFLLFIVNSFNTSVGDTLKSIIMVPLDILELIASNALPIFNLVIYVIFQTPIQLLYHIVIGEGKTHLVYFVKGFANSFPLFTASAQNFVNSNTKSCKSHMIASQSNRFDVGTSIQEKNIGGGTLSLFICTNSSVESPGIEKCSPIPAGLEAFSCFDLEKREMDLYTGFMQWQQASGHAIMTLGSSCEAIALLANITLFPLADPLFWKSLDRFGNGILNALVVAPTSAIQRCSLAGGFLQRPAMCTPDFGPAFDLLAAGSILLGQALTHWMDVAYLLLMDTPSKSNDRDIIFGTCDQGQNYQALLSQDDVRNKVMGSNVTVLVRMAPTTFALTDGYSAMFVEQDGPLRRSYVPGLWSKSVNPKYGIARTIMPSGSSVNDNGIGLFGCSCTTITTTPNNSSVQLECAIATKNGNSWILPVEWSLSSETQLLTCSRLRIVVQSLRWPEKRVVTSELNGYTKSNIDLDCTFGENCLIGDVAIYAIPICGSQDGVKAMACFPEKYFTRGICFPYCMALHMRNEMTRPIVMRGAMEWEQGVLIAQRDCSPFQTVQPKTQQSQELLGTEDDEEEMETTCTVQSKQAIQDTSYSQVITHTQSVADQSKQCSFRSACITRIRNKTLIPDYASAVTFGSVPIIRTQDLSIESGARLVLNYQPLVVAGGVQLRRYTAGNGEDVVDFPTLVGNQRNEFTIESFSYVGIPVANPASVPSEEDVRANAEPGKIFLPQALSYVQVHIPTSPATLSTDALWYATNPSYEFLYAMINYCATEGAFSQTQIMIISSYSPMRIWRVQYKTSGCYLSGSDMTRICSPDVAKSFPMSDPAYDIPKLNSETLKNSSTLMDMCTSNRLLNLWVESLETFDEYNIVIMIRRGRFQDMGYLLDDMQRLKNNGDVPIQIKKGSSVFYFMSRFDFKIRQDYPWKMTDYLRFLNLSSPSTSLFDTTCPQLRVVPDIGRFVGNSLTALIHLMKTPINFLLNPFAIQEVLLARAYQRCPENSLMHSTLDNCGMNLFSLTNYFESMYTANEAFWEFTSWIVLKITGSLTDGYEGTAFDKEIQIFNQFLRGAIVLGDASKIISMFDVTRTMEFMDIGVEEVIFKTGSSGRRRHLLNAEEDKKSKSGGSLTSIFSHLTGFAKGGLGSLFSITKSVSAGVAGNLFSGADLGSLMASQNPMASIIGTSLSMPVLAWAQVTYESLLPIALDILANAQNRMFTLKPIWVHMYDTLDLYDHVIHERHKQACLGYRLMIGYTSSLGAAVYYNCLAAAEMPRGVWTVALTVIVDMNLYRCLCVNPAGQEYLAYTYKNCEYLMSSNRKGLWQNILSTQSIHQVCQQYSIDIEKQLYGAFDAWTLYGFEASDAMTSVIDEFFVHRSHMFDCNNVNSNPTAIVLTPLPIHHFHVCGKTTSCRLKCEESIMVFEAERNRVKKAGSVEALRKQKPYVLDIESPFFNKYSGDWGGSSSTSLLQNRNKYIRAIKTQKVDKLIHEDDPCKLRCKMTTTKQTTPISLKCITVLTEHVGISTNTYEISFYCIPSAGSILASVFNTGIQNDHALSGLDGTRSREGMKITHMEFSIQNTTVYSASTFTIVYGSKETTTWSMNSQVALNEYHEITLWKTKPFYSSAEGIENAQRSNIIDSADIASTILDESMITALFGRDVDVFQPQVASCKIMSVVEIYSGVPNKFTFFFSTRVQVQALLKQKVTSSTLFESGSNLNTQTEFRETYMIYGVVHHCDYDNSLKDSNCMKSINYYVPCTLCEQLGRENSECHCETGIDQVLQMAEQGSFLHSSDTMYFFLPTNNNRLSYNLDGKLDAAWLQSLGDGRDFSLTGMKVNIDPHTGIVPSKNKVMYRFDENIPATVDALGSWSRLDVFSTTLINTKPVRDVILHGDSITPMYFFQVDGSEGKTSIASEWLQQSRISLGTRSWIITGYKSATTRQTSSLIINCNISSCFGCGTSSLRLLCHAAQDCTLAKCIGTMVQTRNVFCGVGNVFEKMTTHAILTWRAIFMSIAEIMLILMRGLAGDTIREISLKFPTDQFYTLVCSCKDTFASIIGLGMSIIQTLTSNTLYGSRMDLVGDGGLSLAGDTEDVGALVGEKTLKTASVGGLFFNMITSSTLIPTLALHRFLLCTLNSSLANQEEDDASLSIEFEDIAMDQTWLTCVRVGGIANIINSIDMKNEVGTIIEAFVSFSLSLLTGLGETVLYALQLSFDSTIDLFISLVWSLQDILYTFNMRSCKVPNYALRYVLWCSCNDTAMSIPQDRRAGGMKDGALWCVGTLSVNLIDGTSNAIIYNPYSLDTLTDGVSSITQYIECLSSTNDPTSSCEGYKSKYGQKLSWLVDQGVEPIAVWAKCKNNYLQNTWDMAAGAIFTENIDSIQGLAENPFANKIGKSIRNQWINWAKNEVSEDFLSCMQEPSRLNIDYSSCMRQYFNIKWQQTPSAYFLYQQQQATTNGVSSALPPDSCHVFSGIANSNATPYDSAIRQQFRYCMMEQESIVTMNSDNEKTNACEMNPIIWSTSQSNKVSIAKYHGTVPPWSLSFLSLQGGGASNVTESSRLQQITIQKYYDLAIEKLKKAWAQFNATFQNDAKDIDVMLFSADGDFIHNFFDCMYLGPYTRVDLFPCDKDDVLDCPNYARDDLGGKTRNFSKCFGPEIMYNDSSPPYTCGSRERRSIIKFFFREILNKQNLAINVSDKIHSQITLLFNNYTSLDSLGCYNSTSGKCTLQACSLENGFAPCLDTNFVISSQEVEKFIVEAVFRFLPDYYTKTMQDTLPWTLYSNISRPQTQDELPFQWRDNPQKAHIARDLHHFSPEKPIRSYDTSEVYSMSLTTEQERTMSSLWSTCMALLGQSSLTIPVENRTAQDIPGNIFEVPVGIWESLLKLRQNTKTLDMTKIEDLETMVRGMIDSAMKSHSPFIWHKNKRHAPSQSAFCKRNDFAFHPTSGSDLNIHVGPLVIDMQDEQQGSKVKHTVANPPRNVLIRQRGFYRDTIGEAHLSCVCATISSKDISFCQIEHETCDTFKSLFKTSMISTESCSLLLGICNGSSSSSSYLYPRSRASEVQECLRNLPDGRVRCPEFALSDILGFYPVDCSSEECENTKSWLGIGSMNIEYPATRFINDGRGGIRLPNYKHFNSTYHNELNFKEQIHKSTDYAIEKCFDVDDLIPESPSKEATVDLLVDDFISKLFPVVQVVHESHVMAVCSRFIIEIARIQALRHISDSYIEENILQSMTWKTKCESKLRHLKMCDMLGMFYDIPPPNNWKELAKPSCPVTLEMESEKRGMFLTPWCILIDQSNRKIYDAQLCGSQLKRTSSRESDIFLDIASVLSDCDPLYPSPFSILSNNNDEEYGYPPLSMLFYEDRLLHKDYWIEELLFSGTTGLNPNRVYQNGLDDSTPEKDHISHILDWWPDDLLDMLPGFHITASSDIQELAPILFDSHFAYDSELNVAHYVHTSLRNESMVFENIGACGICRSSTIDMPILDSNTNRICTRMSKHSHLDIPTFPVYEQKRPGGSEDARTTWPIDDEFIERHFYGEFCADKATDIPWTPRMDDPLSSSAGGIPGWSLFTETDTTGATRFLDTIDQSFPPKIPDPLFHDINEAKIFSEDSSSSASTTTWGPCKSCVQWLPAIPCDTVDSSKMCPDYQSSCLKIAENTTEGICFPSTTYASSSVNKETSFYRYPCFASFHCPDDQVCLADGGCHPLYLHIWNNQEYPVEFSVISDNCAFSDENHPYTQTTTGASPWEQVPDILHVHGFCSLHDWFSYRHSIRTKLCPLESSTQSSTYLACDSANTSWPWVLERFDGTKPTNKNERTFSEEKLLHLVPHPCDQSFMHLGNPWDTNKRLQICSGFQGQQRPFVSDTFNTYDLNTGGDWNDISFLDTSNSGGANTTTNSYWMRTKDTNDNVHIGIIGFEENVNDVPLGFLGANMLDSNAMADLTRSNKDGNAFRFFKCVDRLACSLPPFTYNGIPTMRLDPYTFASNYSEISLRLCGAIGYIAPPSFWENQDVYLKLCILDNPMFPLLNVLLSSTQSSTRRGCQNILWNTQDTKTRLNIVDSSVKAILSMASSSEIAEKNLIHCSTTDWTPDRNHRLCVFQARLTRQLTEANTNDHISQITDALNSLIIDSPNAIFLRIREEEQSTDSPEKKPVKTWIYENINECAFNIQTKNLLTHTQLQSRYQTLGASGIYIALRFGLSEIPVGWLHHAWLITLLSTIDVRFSVPNLNYHFYPSTANNNNLLPLWANNMVSYYCNDDDDLRLRSVLLTLLCKKQTMEYSFYSTTSNFISDLKVRIKERARTDIARDVVINSENTNVFCYETAKWDCESKFSNDYEQQELCRNAMIFAHNTTSLIDTEYQPCPLGIADVSTFFLDPCSFPQNFRLEDRVQLPDTYYTPFSSTKLSTILADIEKSMMNSFLEALDKIVVQIDYIAKPLGEVLLGNSATAIPLGVLKILPLAANLNAQTRNSMNFDFENWFKTVCTDKFQPTADNVCKWQQEIPTNSPCMYPNSVPTQEYLRYASSNDDEDGTSGNYQGKNVIEIKYKDEKTEYIDICDDKYFPQNADPANEICVVQYLGNTSFLDEHDSIDDNNKVKCDITQVNVPPGIEVQAFAFRFSKEEWQDMIETRTIHTKACTRQIISDPKVRSCAWKNDFPRPDPQTDAWWYGASPTIGHSSELMVESNLSFSQSMSYIERGHALFVGFDGMQNIWWKNKNSWKEEGCGDFISVCALKFRLENIPGQTRAECRNTVPPCSFIIDQTKNSAGFQGYHAFATAKDITADNKFYRCAPCTRADSKINKKEKPGLFGCEMVNSEGQVVKSASSRFSSASTSKYLSYLEKSQDFETAFQTDDRKTQVSATTSALVFSEDVNDFITSLIVQMTPTTENPIEKESMHKWGLRSTQQPCLSALDSMCTTTNLPSSFSIQSFRQIDQRQWDEAISNPNRAQTMDCQSQTISDNDFSTCNPNTNKRRDKLNNFVDKVYRRHNGIWLPKVYPRQGVAWQANVAHPNVKMFSILHTSAARTDREVMTKYVLGPLPCSNNDNIKDRICVESLLHSNLRFEPLHPWLGGNFNPFEGSRGFDECSLSTSSRQQQHTMDTAESFTKRAICQCECDPKIHCEDKRGIYNYSEAFKEAHFPQQDSCIRQTYPKSFVMSEDDDSNLCSFVQRKRPSSTTVIDNQPSNLCFHHQGILGGINTLHSSEKTLNKIPTDDFFSTSGISTNPYDFLIQSMYSPALLDVEMMPTTSTGNGIWMGKTLMEETNVDGLELFAFLKMSRGSIHPAHIAFSFDKEKTNSPLVVKAIALLPYFNQNYKFPTYLVNPGRWLQTLPLNWKLDAITASEVYPSFIQTFSYDTFRNLINKTTSFPATHTSNEGHWSCPFRIVSFWGNPSTDMFSPHIPNPLLSKILFPGFQSAHPLIKMRSAREKLKLYKTTNGICFYETRTNTNIFQDDSSIEYVPLSDASNPCGLKQMMWHLHEGTWSISRVMNHFHSRCQDIIDFPGLNASFRSDEVVYEKLHVKESPCGVLHRITPFLMRTKGNATNITKHRAGLTTLSQGGDCHMGRALKFSYRERSKITGQSHVLFEKHKHGGTLRNINAGTQQFLTLERAVPMTLSQLFSKKRKTFKYQLYSSSVSPKSFITFKGPGNPSTDNIMVDYSTTVLPEISFGLHYGVSLTRMLANDLKYQCQKKYNTTCSLDDLVWKGGFEFLKLYVENPQFLIKKRDQSQTNPTASILNLLNKLFRGVPQQSNTATTTTEHAKAHVRDETLWKTPNWTWSYYVETNHTTNLSNNETSSSAIPEEFDRMYIGTVNRSLWRRNRFEACKQSHKEYFLNSNRTLPKNAMEFNTMRITLCEPAPTGSLQEFCRQLLQFRQDIALINCQIMGKNDCLYSPGMFYVPYAWSPTNQEFSADTVLRYYREVIEQKFQDQTMEAVCPARNSMMNNLIKLSLQTRNQCPAEQIEYLKDTFNSIKSIGKDILYMGYCLVMFVLNIVALVFTKTGEAGAAMTEVASMYMKEFFGVAAKIIMPILNAFISLIFGTSSSGKIIQEIFVYLCEIYNWIMENILVKVWCAVVLPILGVIFEIIKVVIGSFSPGIRQNIDTIWSVLNGGRSAFDPAGCIGNLRLTMVCRPPDESRSFNASNFYTHHLATRCWIDSKIKNGYSSSVFGGSSDFSFLSCSVSDTCAKDPIRIDDYQEDEHNLIACASCPEVDLEDSTGQKFGCNTLLKRCTCSVNTKTTSQCVTNGECAAINPTDSKTCGISKSIDNVRNAPSNVPCTQCGQLGLQPVCVVDGKGDAGVGVCACSSIKDAGFLSRCPPEMNGQTMLLVSGTGKCLISPNNEMAALGSAEFNIDFSSAAIGACALGLTSTAFEARCLKVTLPAQNSFYDSTKTNFVVITNFLLQENTNILSQFTSVSGQRRRLLTLGNDSNNVFHDVHPLFIDILFECVSSTTTIVVQDRNTTQLSKILQNPRLRNKIKDCIHSLWTNQQMTLLFNVTAQNMLFHPFALSYWLEQTRGKGLISFARDSIAPVLSMMLVSNISLFHLFRFNYSDSNNNSSSLDNETIYINKSKPRRRILATNDDGTRSTPTLIPIKLPSQTCFALEKPLQDISNAFWDTVRLYHSRSNANEQQQVQGATNNNTTTSSEKWWYSFPPLNSNATVSSPFKSEGWMSTIAYTAISWTLSGGSASGEQIIQAMTLNLSYDDATKNNYFTGTRLISDLSRCNFTTITFGPQPSKPLLPWLLLLFMVTYMISTCCSSSTILSMILWLIFFPVLLFWTVYNVSPLCWPMVPSKLPKDVTSEISKIIPTSIKIPYYLLHTECLSYKTIYFQNESFPFPTSKNVMDILASRPNKNVCFKKCAAEPFLMKTWQDPLAWWMCEINTDVCRWVADNIKTLPVCKDFVSSAFYFSEVLKLRDKDNEFVQAHRFCAIFSSHEIVFATAITLSILLISPSIFQFIAEIFSGAVILVIHASNAENV